MLGVDSRNYMEFSLQVFRAQFEVYMINIFILSVSISLGIKLKLRFEHNFIF